MKCYECNSPTVTLYWHNGQIIKFPQSQSAPITHVNKACTVCPWMSYRTKIPDKLVSD